MNTPARLGTDTRHDPSCTVRTAAAADLPAIAAIYAHHALHGSGTFDEVAPDLIEMGKRRDQGLGGAWPWLVAECQGMVVGYAGASDFRPRRGYRFCVEDAVYVAADEVGRGIGKQLLGELVVQCEAAGARQMVALVGDSANAASLALHRGLGFREIGVMSAVGWKLGRWLDVVVLQRTLGPGAATVPQERA